jgi:hypothetical protein
MTKMQEQKHRIKRKTLIADIDTLMLELSGMENISCTSKDSAAISAAKTRTKFPGFCILFTVILLSWGIWFFGEQLLRILLL